MDNNRVNHLGKKFLIGNANYSFLFWDIYDAELYSASNKYNSNELAIILKYNRSIDKETLIRETMNDIKEQKNISNQQEKDWKSLYQLSEKTFVEETESLKKGAAGAGLTDND